MNDESEDDLLRIAIKTLMYHADLYFAAEKMGGIDNLAGHLKINAKTLGKWIRLQSFPVLEYFRKGKIRKNKALARKWPSINRKLFSLTGKSSEQLFPDFVRLSGFLDSKKESTRIVEVNAGLMLGFQEKQPKAIECGTISRDDLKQNIQDAMKILTSREREVLELRYGLNDKVSCSLEDVGKALGISRERVRQIEAKAKRKILNRSDKPLKAAAEILDFHECPNCKTYVPAFDHCEKCAVVMCKDCIVSHKHKCEAAE